MKTNEHFIVGQPGYSERRNSGGGRCKHPSGSQLTELWLARRIVAEHGKDLRHCHGLGRLVFDGVSWRRDETQEWERRAKMTICGLLNLAAEVDDEAKRAAILAFERSCERAGRIKAVLDLVESEPGVAIRTDDLDSDPWLFNVANGTVDLRTGKLRRHNRGDLLTKVARVSLDPSATCPQFDRFFEEIVPVERVRGFIARATGAAMVGLVRDHVLHLLEGRGCNGKSTLIKTIQAAFGDYAAACPQKLLLAQKHASHPTEIAKLHGLRFAFCLESGEDDRLDEEKVKWLTGGERITARFMRQDYFDFDPSHTLFMASNHRPRIQGTDDGIWRRVMVWPFGVTIQEVDTSLGERLANELPGVLAWAVRGCLRWQEMGLAPPEEVVLATRGYREESDSLGAFISETCVVTPLATVGAGELYERYQSWARKSGEAVISQRKLGMAMSQRGFERGNDTRTRRVLYKGIKIAD